ncbi:MAG: YncE family protein [candidate division NC10 bacterium]|nr:YncE family protein [candidate division NC10 bacterium]
MKGTRAGLFVLMVSLALALFAAQAKASPYLYVADSGASKVVVVDLQNGDWVSEITVPTPYGISITPDGKKAYTANKDNATCSVLDLNDPRNMKVKATISVGAGAQHVAISPDGTRGYVANTDDGFISVLDTVEDTLLDPDTHTFDEYGYMTYTTVSKDGQRVFTTDGWGAAWWFDSAGNLVATESANSSLPCGVLRPDDKELYVSSPNERCIYILSTDTDPSSPYPYLYCKGTIRGAYGRRMLFNQAGTKLFVTNYWQNCVQIVDLAANPIQITSITGISSPVGLALTPDESQLLVSGQLNGGGVVAAIDVSTKQVTKYHGGFNLPAELAIVAGGAEPPPPPKPLEVAIDIKPGSSPNSINPKSQGKIPVAILSSPDFNAAAKVDITSLTFGRTGDENSLSFVNPSAQDVNGDGLPDLMCHFWTQQCGFQVGDTEGTLKGKTLDGVSFQAKDSIRIVPGAK